MTVGETGKVKIVCITEEHTVSTLYQYMVLSDGSVWKRYYDVMSWGNWYRYEDIHPLPEPLRDTKVGNE